MFGNGTLSPTAYLDRLEAFKRSDDERIALVTAVVNELDELKLKYAEKVDDYNNEVASRRMWQAKAAQSEQALTLSKQASVSNNFCLALIDGDGAIFQDYLYTTGKDGGADAAHQLHAALRRHLQEIYPDANVSDWNIVVQVILNLQGLAAKLQSCGTISNPSELHAFGRAFGLAQPLFSMVDCGSGKERADHKIRETLRMFLPIAQCKHVFFAPCHDNGYLPVLEPYRRDPAVASRITLIETRPAEPGYLELGFKMIKITKVFRRDNLPASRPTIPGIAPLPAPPTRTLPVVQPTPNPLVPNSNMTPNHHPKSKSTSPAPSIDSINSTANSSSWATVGKTGAATKSFSIAPKKSGTARRHILLNAYNDRLDLELPKADPAAEGRFAERLKTQGKCCNNYHLVGRCDAGEYCDYLHGERLSPGELLVLKHKARSRTCQAKSYCRDFDCTCGHHCKYGATCWLDWCHFAHTHTMDMEPAKRYFYDGSEERIQGFLERKR